MITIHDRMLYLDGKGEAARTPKETAELEAYLSDDNQHRIDTAFLMSVETPDLTPDQANHVVRIAKLFCLTMAKKYTKGQREHGGDLFNMPVLDLVENALHEAIDQVVYLTTLRDSLVEAINRGTFEPPAA